MNSLSIEGARILYTIPVLGGIPLSETVVMSWIVMAIITGVCIWLTRDLKVENITKRQAVAEMLVETVTNFTRNNMGGEAFDMFIPFVAALFSTSVVSNLISLFGVWSPTADLSTEAAWAIVVYIIINYYKIKVNGVGGFLKGFTEPIAVMTPFNILSDLATPISMACRHFGNILAGFVISSLIYWSLGLASHALLGLVSSTLANIPILAVGIPAVLSFYFDWFSGVMQAFIFCMLTTMFIGNAAATE